MGDNGILLAVALLERVRPYLHENTREQISRSELVMMNQSLSQALDKLCVYAGVGGMLHIVGTLVGVRDLVEGLLEDGSYQETDLGVKDMLAGKLLESLGKLYMEAGKYYADNDFNYSMRLGPLLNRIVDACVDGGYYFGVDEEIARR